MEMKPEQICLLDGGMGTQLQEHLRPGEAPELLNLRRPEVIEQVHRNYLEAGSRILLTNTFGANRRKLEGKGVTVAEVVSAAVGNARRAAGSLARVALDIGPIGEMLRPLGTLDPQEAESIFSEVIDAGVRAGADLIYFETFSDLMEIRAGILAARDRCDLPVFATMTFEATGRTFLGVSAEAAALSLSALGVSAVGINCSIGPEAAAGILERMAAYTDLPLILKPNAGMPDPMTGAYEMTPEEFARQMASHHLADYLGGCCGTTPAFIRALSDSRPEKTQSRPAARSGLCSMSRVVHLDGGIHVIGERINPTGKKKLQEVLRQGDLREVERLAAEQEEAGAELLDINVGVPGVDEVRLMREVVLTVTAVSSLPLCIDSTNPQVLEAGLRTAPGRCLINSVNASEASMDSVLPLARKYGAAIVALAMGKSALPQSTEERLKYARTICTRAEAEGIRRENICVDCLTLTAGAQQDQVQETLRAVRDIRRQGMQTVLGVSNISFGLPERLLLTRTFLSQAIACGLTLPILNPCQKEIMDTVDACRVLTGEDEGARRYSEMHAMVQVRPQAEHGVLSLEDAILRGLEGDAEQAVRELLVHTDPMEVISRNILPALDEVGTRYETQQIFLPQLMNSAKAAGAAFDVLRAQMSGGSIGEKGPIVLATVEGDIHDIGKNIVRTVLENTGFKVIDLGRDVPAERVLEAALQNHARLVGLSALMTTTLPGMKRTIDLFHEKGIRIPIVVGGAVLTQAYADEIGADYYAKDAKQTQDIARSLIPD